MTNTVKHEDVVSGMWKFHENITPEELIGLAEEWKNGSDGDRYLDLHIRKCSKDQFGIGFMYCFEPNPRGHHPFFYKITDKLKRRFGNDFVGWDVSSPTWIIK